MKRILPLLAALLVCTSTAVLQAAPKTLKVDGVTFAVIDTVDASTYSVRLFLGPPPGSDTQKGFSVLFGADDAGKGYRLDAADGRWTLTDTGSGRRLDAGGGAPVPTGDELDVLIKRRDWLLTVAVNGRVLAEVADTAYTGGSIAVDPRLSAPYKGKTPIVQPIGDLAFEEGFMRPQDELELTNWQQFGGTWKLHSVREEADDMPWEQRGEARFPQSERSANPFTMSGWGEPAGLIATKGHWFWDDYTAAVSLRNMGAQALGFAFNVVAKDDYFLLRWSDWKPTLGPTCIRLLRVRGDSVTELQRAWVDGEIDQWYRLKVITAGTRIRAVLDEAVIMDVHHPESLGGEIGLYVKGGDEKNAAQFDDIVLHSTKTLDYDDRAWLGQHLAAHEGRWVNRKVSRPARPDNYAAVLSGTDGRILLGSPGWAPPVVSARVSAPAIGQSIGFEAGIGGGAEPWRLTLGRTESGATLTLHRGSNGGSRVAAVTGLAPAPGSHVELRLDLTRPNECNAYVDGKLWLHTWTQELGDGAVAIFASGFAGAEFRDLRVAFERDEDVERLPNQDLFVVDPFMQHWSSPQGAWWPENDVTNSTNWWHVGDFYGRADVLLPVRDGGSIVFAAEELGAGKGYAISLSAVEGGTCTAVLKRDGVEVARGEFQEPKPTVKKVQEAVPGRGELEYREVERVIPPRIAVHMEKPYIWLSLDGTEVLSFRDEAPLAGTRTALLGYDSASLENILVQRDHVRDYYFESAPFDWFRVGTWKVTTRFACDPRWSFMAALADQNAVLFNKYRYTGDFTLEAHMGMRMDARGRGNYVRVGDMNMSLLGGQFDMDNAYHFVTAGWDRHISDSLTYLARGAKHLVETTERLLPNSRRASTRTRVLPTPWVAAGRDIHGAWYYFKTRKQGDTLESYVDNHQVYSVQDEDVLDTVYPAVWTYSADVVVARVRMSYQRREVPGRLVEAPEGEAPVNVPDIPAPTLVSSTHRGFMDDFEGGERGWSTYAQQSASLRIAADEDGGHFLEVVNPGVGGLFEAIAPVSGARVSARDVRSLSFRYRMTPEVKINLYVRVGDQYYYAHMTGPEEDNPFYLPLGSLPLQADGKWHTAQFPLGAAIRALETDGPRTGEIVTLAFGNLHRGEVQMGIGGNPIGARYGLDDVRLVTGGGADLRVAADPASMPSGSTLLTAVAREPVAEPADEGNTVSRTLDAPGQWYVSACIRNEAGERGAVGFLPLLVANEPVTVTPVRPAAGASWDFGPIELVVGGENTPFVERQRLGLTVNGVPVSNVAECVSMDWTADRLAIDLQRAQLNGPLAARPGKDTPLKLKLSWTDGLGRVGSQELTYAVDPAADRTPPTRVELEGFPGTDTFEDGMGAWRPGDGVAAMLDSSTAASGSRSIMVQNQSWGGSWLMQRVAEPFSLGKFPIIEFDYRIHEGVMFDLSLATRHGAVGVGVTDREKSGPDIGNLPDIVADDQWHHVAFNAQDAIGALPYLAHHYRVNQLTFGDFGGYRSNGLGAYYRMDNFRLVPLVSSIGGLTVTAQATDAGGIAGYSYEWTTDGAGQPDDVVDATGPQITFESVPGPDAWLHIKACDTAGNWGPVSSHRFLVDGAAPTVAKLVPSDGTRAAPETLRIVLDDAVSALDPDELRVVVDGRLFTPDSANVTFDPRRKTMVIDWLGARAGGGVVDGHEVKMRVNAADFAGNAMAPLEATWTMDYSLDKTPPRMPVVDIKTISTTLNETFETGLGGWEPARGADGASLAQRPVVKGGQDQCLELTCDRPNTRMSVIATKQRIDLEKFPHLSFDCQIPRGVNVNMQVQLDGAWYEVKLTAPKAVYNVVADAGIKPGNEWQHVSVDLLKIAETVRPGRKDHVLNVVMFGDMARNGNRQGAKWMLDNFRVSSWGAQKGQFELTAEDVTGIKGYNVVFDRKPDTEVAAGVTLPKGRVEYTFTEAGTWWMHVRACDSNGNWSTTRHVSYPVEKVDAAVDAVEAAVRK